MKANYYIRDVRPDDSRNSWCITVLLDAGAWPERSRPDSYRDKGATVDRYRFSRTMTEEEAKATIHQYRLTFYRYQSWQDLLVPIAIGRRTDTRGGASVFGDLEGGS